MADRGVAGQPIDHFTLRERVADQTEPPLGMKTHAVEADDAGGLLAAMLRTSPVSSGSSWKSVIEEQDVRLHRHGPGDCKTLLPSARKPARVAVDFVGEAPRASRTSTMLGD